MSDKIQVDIGATVRNIHTGEIFVVESIFVMRKVEGGKYTPRKTWSQGHLLSSDDWVLVAAAPDAGQAGE